MKAGEAVFVDSGAWIALALTRDPFHAKAADTWETIVGQRALLHTSAPVVLETFTYLDRRAKRDVAIAWKDSLERVDGLRILACAADDVRKAWRYFEHRDLHKLSAVDATSFVLMDKHGIKAAFTFDHHFASVGFRMVG